MPEGARGHVEQGLEDTLSPDTFIAVLGGQRLKIFRVFLGLGGLEKDLFGLFPYSF